MNRRKLLKTTAITALATPFISRRSMADTANADLLNTTLTPLGAERGASASGLVPAWTGGAASQIPSSWQPGDDPPELYGDDQPLFTVAADNMAQYADMLCDGQKEMLTRFGGEGFKMIVYPCRRSAWAPQYVYDNTALNVTRTQIAPQGVIYGFTGAYAGAPFPIIDPSDKDAGAKIMWNHLLRWQGYSYTLTDVFYVMSSDGELVLTGATDSPIINTFYDPHGSPESFGVFFEKDRSYYTAPINLAGEQIVAWESTSPAVTPFEAWLYLVGEGRIRKAPEQSYDSPETLTNGSTNDDETEVFNGALDRYDWKLLGKKEIIIPYNNYKNYHEDPAKLFGPKFMDPSVVRWEVHRCWVVDATLAPGKRHVEPHRRFYVEEDTWTGMLADAWDAQGNYWKFQHLVMECQPGAPGMVWDGGLIYNLQANEYVYVAGSLYSAQPPFNKPAVFAPLPATLFDPQAMAGQARF